MPAPTFPAIPPDQPSPGEEVKYRTLRNKFGEGYEEAASQGINGQDQTWKYMVENLDNSYVNTIIAFLDERAGHKPFWFTPPGGIATLWTCEERSRSNYRPSSSTLQCTFKRWYGAEE